MKKTDKVEGNSIGQGLLWMSGVFTGLCFYSFRLCTFLLTSRIATLALARTHLQCWSRRPTIRQKRRWRRKRWTARSGLLRQLRLYRICCCYSCLYLHERQKWSADPFEPKRLPRAVSNRPFASRLLCAQTPPSPQPVRLLSHALWPLSPLPLLRLPRRLRLSFSPRLLVLSRLFRTILNKSFPNCRIIANDDFHPDAPQSAQTYPVRLSSHTMFIPSGEIALGSSDSNRFSPLSSPKTAFLVVVVIHSARSMTISTMPAGRP